MDQRRIYQVTVNYLGAAPPYAAGILAAPKLVLPPGAQRAQGNVSLWDGVNNIAFGASVYFALVPTAGAAADIRVYQFSSQVIALPPRPAPDDYEWCLVAFAAAPAFVPSAAVRIEVG